jgi:hypothetical protein
VSLVAAALTLNVMLFAPLGFVAASAVLFACVSAAFGSRRFVLGAAVVWTNGDPLTYENWAAFEPKTAPDPDRFLENWAIMNFEGPPRHGQWRGRYMGVAGHRRLSGPVGADARFFVPIGAAESPHTGARTLLRRSPAS